MYFFERHHNNRQNTWAHEHRSTQRRITLSIWGFIAQKLLSLKFSQPLNIEYYWRHADEHFWRQADEHFWRHAYEHFWRHVDGHY